LELYVNDINISGVNDVYKDSRYGLSDLFLMEYTIKTNELGFHNEIDYKIFKNQFIIILDFFDKFKNKYECIDYIKLFDSI
jgi:hypothetical protein